MAYLSNYQNDMFFSYAHAEFEKVHKRNGLGWTHIVHRDIGQAVNQLLNTTPENRVEQWIDRKLAGNDRIPTALEHEVREAALFVAFVSPRYLQSEWCRKEVDWFVSSKSHDPEAHRRVFVVKAEETDPAFWPKAFQDKTGFEFFTVDDDGMSWRLGGYLPQMGKDDGYEDAIKRISSRIARELKRIKAEERDSGRAPDITAPAIREDMPRPRESAAAPAPDSAIYVAQTNDVLKPARFGLMKSLQEKSLHVLPEIRLIGDKDAVDTAAYTAIGQADIYVQLINEYSGDLFPYDIHGLTGYQYKIAQELGKPTFLMWHAESRWEDAFDPEYRDFLEGISGQFIDTKLEDFAGRIEEFFTKRQQETTLLQPAAPARALPLIYMYAGQPDDRRFAREKLLPLISKYDFQGMLIDHESDLSVQRKDYDRALKTSHAIMLVSGRADPEWHEKEFKEMYYELLDLGRLSTPGKEIYLAIVDAPSVKTVGPGLGQNVQILQCFDHDENQELNSPISDWLHGVKASIQDLENHG